MIDTGFRDFKPKKKTVVEGEEVSMQIYCTKPGECNHDKVSWFIKNDEILFDPSDPHFRRESMRNLHRLWIDMADSSDEGIFSVRKQDEEKHCELEVLGNLQRLCNY